MECLPRFQRRPELQCHFPGDLNQPFDGCDMLVEVFPGGRSAHPFFDLARMLHGEVEHRAICRSPGRAESEAVESRII
jgi:hypothetical protein